MLLTGCSSSIAVTADPRPFLCPPDGKPPAIDEVKVSKADRLTEGTASQIEANNLARRALCGGPLPPPAKGKDKVPVSALREGRVS